MDTSDLRLIQVVAGRYRTLLGERVGDPKDLLGPFERAVEGLILPPERLLPAKKFIEGRVEIGSPIVSPEFSAAADMAMKAAAVIKYGQNRVADPGHQLFLAILQTYTLPPALRKKIEMASRIYLKSTKPRFKEKRSPFHYLEYIQVYEKYIALLQSHIAYAKEAIAKGKEHTEEGAGATKMKVGPFTLVNTGGFSEKQMNEVADVVQKATAFAQSSGFGEACYGEVQVTNTISKANVLAFYLLAKDEMFVRANVKASTDVVRTFLHELGHRYEHKFLASKKGGIARLYQMLSGQERNRAWDPKKQKFPEPGETLEAKGRTYVVRRTIPGPGLNGFKVLLDVQGDPSASARVPLDAFWQLKGVAARDIDTNPNYIGFVTDYAKKGGPSENFAEMFAFYCMGRLPVLQSVPFEELVFGTSKSAAERQVHRVANRFRASGLG